MQDRPSPERVGGGATEVGGSTVRYDAILPAGGRIEGELAAKTGTDEKALIPWDGAETLAERTVRILRETPGINRIAVGGNVRVAELLGDRIDAHGLRGETAPRTLANAIAALENPTEKILVVTTDLPFLTADVVSGFLRTCRDDVDVNVPIVRAEAYEERFPGTTNTYIPLKGGRWTAGGAFLLDRDAFLRSLPKLDAMFHARKSKWAMAKLLGPVTLTKFVTKSLTVDAVEDTIRRILGASGRAIPGSAPELAFDIDDLDDYRAALQFRP